MGKMAPFVDDRLKTTLPFFRTTTDWGGDADPLQLKTPISVMSNVLEN